MAGAGIEAPYTIASIPEPLDSTYGRVQIAPVNGVKNSRKRKRHEVAVGIDGEGVNIYNVQSQNQLTSYAIPPHSYLSCPPCSVYNRSTSTEQAQRATFAVLKEGRDSSKRRLVSFAEDVRGKRKEDVDLSGPVKRECKLHDGQVLGVDFVPSSTDENQYLIANYRNGLVEFIKKDLSKTHREECRPSGSDESFEVEYATTLDIESARRGVLKGREDIAALLNQNDSLMRTSALLFRLTRSGENSRRAELYAVQHPFNNPLQSSKSALQLLTQYQLPSRTSPSGNTVQYELHVPSGTLYQLLDGRLSVFDLSGTVPKLATEVGSKSVPVESFARVSASTVLTVSSGIATLLETSFGSKQASASIKSMSTLSTRGKKRKRDDANESVSCNLISTFTELGLVVGLAGTELIGLQLGGDFRESRTGKTKTTRLSDVLNKGSLKATHKGDRSEKKAAKWDEWTAKVDALIASDDIEGLEKLIANDSKLGRQRKEKRSHRDSDEPNGMPNGDATVIEDMWPLPEGFEPQKLDKRKVLYILSKVFGFTEGAQNDLEVRVPSFKILEWLALTGYLNASHTIQAFRMFADSPDRRVGPGDIVGALKAIDDDFQLLHDLFTLPVHWEAAEVVQALRVVVQSFDSAAPETARLALPAPPLTNGDKEMINGDVDQDGDFDAELDLETEAAENELDRVMSALTNGLEVRSELLRVILLRLHAFPYNTARDSMRALMSHSEIIFLIHILRIELADGGWTSKYVDTGDEDSGQGAFVNTLGDEAAKSSPNDQAIVAIVDLLNCAVDAIGASGWLVGESGSAGELIESLRAEISAGLEGCYEANTLGMLFAEVERCAGSAGKAQPQIVMNGEDSFTEASLFPLGSRFEPVVVVARNDKGAQKSKRAIGLEKSKQVGKYSFERIRI